MIQGYKLRKVLLIENDEPFSQIFCGELKEAGFKVYHAFNGKKGMWLAQHKKPDLILLNSSLRGEDNSDVLNILKSTPDTQEIPVILLIREELDKNIKDRFRSKASGQITMSQCTTLEAIKKVEDFFAGEQPIFPKRSQIKKKTTKDTKKNIENPKIQSSARGDAQRERKHILFIDDDEWTRRVYGALLAVVGFKMLYAETLDEGREMARRIHPHLVIIDALMETDEVLGNGIELAQILKKEQETSGIPIVILTSGDFSIEVEKAVKDLGVADYMHKGINHNEFVRRIKKIFEQS